MYPAYCLMTNHIHLLLETGDMEIWKFMKYMSECYAMYLNHKYSYRGHVFESRYKSCLVKEDAYFLQTSRYIHLNPVKAQMTNYPEDYPWSSYQTMIGLSDDRITEKKKTLAYFPKNSIFRKETDFDSFMLRTVLGCICNLGRKYHTHAYKNQ